MNFVKPAVRAMPVQEDPIAAILAAPAGAVLAVIVGVEGPSYRPVGAAMSFLSDGSRTGSLSSGCIEADLAIHARRALEHSHPQTVLYGRGSPFGDLQLPCGGGLQVMLLPRPDVAALSRIDDLRALRWPCALRVNVKSGAMTPVESDEPPEADGFFNLIFSPAVRFIVFGAGPEATTFVGLARSLQFPAVLASGDDETLNICKSTGCETHHLPRASFPEHLDVDPWTAIILFFHDHDWEPPILKGALETTAFYIGAQGSRRARDARHELLKHLGVSNTALARLQGPIGLVPSARDPRTLAVSVLAEVLAAAKVSESDRNRGEPKSGSSSEKG